MEQLERLGRPEKSGKWGGCKYWGHWRNQEDLGDCGADSIILPNFIFMKYLFLLTF